jgi:uncharacterized radical SAM superfamily Fe-S cluster-containing enzyme
MEKTESISTVTILKQTESLCPKCLRVIPAQVVTEGRAVYQEKACPEHGMFKNYLWPDAVHYKWMNSFEFPYHRPQKSSASLQGCPRDCAPARPISASRRWWSWN